MDLSELLLNLPSQKACWYRRVRNGSATVGPRAKDTVCLPSGVLFLETLVLSFWTTANAVMQEGLSLPQAPLLPWVLVIASAPSTGFFCSEKCNLRFQYKFRGKQDSLAYFASSQLKPKCQPVTGKSFAWPGPCKCIPLANVWKGLEGIPWLLDTDYRGEGEKNGQK